MAIFNGRDDLLEKPPSFILLHPSFLHNIVKKLLASVLNDHYNFVFRFYHIIKLDDVGMSKKPKIGYFTLNVALHVGFCKSFTVDYFQSDSIMSGKVVSQFDSTERTFA